MKKVAIITFHAAHNYGSMLQAYALQTTVEGLGCECDVINFRTDRQKDLYTVFTKRKGIKYLLKNASHLLYYKLLKGKYDKFESFLDKHIKLTDAQYQSLEGLESADFDYDYYISGSDQIWNPVPADFDWAYYLPFVKNAKRIAYAPSFGPFSSVGDEKTKEQLSKYLRDYDYISVREKGSKKNVKELINKDVQVVLDPTLLLEKEKYDDLVCKETLVNGEFIFLYTLFATPEIIQVAKYFSKQLKLPIVVSNFSNQYDCINPFTKCFSSGPKEMLWFIKNAKLVLASSFHGTVFSIIYNKPFYAIGGNRDARISTLLDITELSERSVDKNNMQRKTNNVFDINFHEAMQKLDKERQKSMDYLRKALDIDGDLR